MANTDRRVLLERTLETFQRVVSFSLKVSVALNGKPTSDAGEMASMVQGKMCINATSADFLAGRKVLDHSAIMTICRMIIESMTLYYYLNEAVDSAQWQCRKVVLELHDTTARIKLMRSEREKKDYQLFLDGRDSLKAKLKSNSYFATLSQEQQARALSGEQIYVGGVNAAAVRAAGWRLARYLSFYNYLSTHAHSAPMSFFRIRAHKIDFGEASEAQLGMVAFALNVAEFCLLRVSMDYLATEPGVYETFDQSDLADFHKELQENDLLTGGLSNSA